MAWIESHQEIARHPKTKKLARLLNTTIPAAIGHLHLLWWWALDFAPDGNLSRFDNSDMADACLWGGKPDDFIGGLSGSGYLDLDLLRIHDWQTYAGRLISLRARKAKRQRKYRSKKEGATETATSALRNGHVTATKSLRADLESSSEPLRNGNVPTNLTGPNLTGPNLTGPDRTEHNHTEPNKPDRTDLPPVAPAHSSADAAATSTGEESDKEPKAKKKKEATPEIISLIEMFRSEYLQNVDAEYQGFKGDYPQSEIDAASFLLRHHGDIVERVIRWVVRDSHPARGPRDWTGWSGVIRSLANIRDAQNWPRIEQRSRPAGMQGAAVPAAPEPPPPAPVYYDEPHDPRPTPYWSSGRPLPKGVTFTREPPKTREEADARGVHWRDEHGRTGIGHISIEMEADYDAHPPVPMDAEKAWEEGRLRRERIAAIRSRPSGSR